MLIKNIFIHEELFWELFQVMFSDELHDTDAVVFIYLHIIYTILDVSFYVGRLSGQINQTLIEFVQVFHFQ